MKKHFFTIFVISFLFNLNAHCQNIQTATFDDGTKINYEILKNSFSDMKKFRINLCPFYTQGPRVEFNYFHLDKFMANLTVGVPIASSELVGIDGTYFLFSSSKKKMYKMSLKSVHTGYKSYNVYTVQTEMEKKKYFGIHGGYYYTSGYRFDGHAVFAGLGFVSGRYIDIMVHNDDPNVKKRKKRSKAAIYSTIYADVIYFPINTVKLTDNEISNGYKSSDIYNTIAFRSYFSEYFSAFNLRLGFQYGPSKERKIHPYLGFGFSF